MLRTAVIVLFVTAVLLSCATSGGGAPSANKPPANPTTVITLESKDAKLTTKDQLIYNAEADCIAWWGKTTDEAAWTVEIKEAGDYFVIAKVACDPQFPGSQVGVTIDNQTVSFIVPDTGTWSSYRSVSAGKISLKPGTYTVLVKAISVPTRFVANLRTLVLEK